MELRDLIVTPVVIFLVYLGALYIRPFATDEVNRKYFLPGLTVKIMGALALGFIYQFYYGGGDTFNFHTHGSRHIWNAFMDSPEKGWKIMFHNGHDFQGVHKYASKIFFLQDPASFAIIRLSAFFDLLTFSSYSATAVLFSVAGFAGSWLLFRTFYKLYPHLDKGIAFATLFIPSVFFWGSGLMKDTITLAAVGIGAYCVFLLFIKHRVSITAVLLLFVSFYVLYVIKIYILLTFLPSLIVWVFMYRFTAIRSLVLKMLLFPFLVVVTVGLAYFATIKAGEDNPKYSMNAIAKTARVTAYDIRYWTGRDAGSGYTLGELDGTWISMIRLAPQAINVSLFRPYLWEVRNPLMLLSALESLALLLFTFLVLYRCGMRTINALSNPTVLFCLVFSITFAFAVGVSTFNFGTLTRYKIPLLPFYFIALMLILDHSKSDKNTAVLERTE